MKKTFKKIINIVILFLIFLFRISILEVQAVDFLKITDINFDNSGAIIFLPTYNQIESTKDISVKTNNLDNPKRTFYDIYDATLTFKNTSYYFKSSDISQITIAQNNVNPNIVRITIYHNQNIDTSKFQLLKLSNGLLFKIKEAKYPDSFLHRIFRQEEKLSSDFFDNLNYSQINNKKEIKTEENGIYDDINITTKDEKYNQINKAFTQNNNITSPESINAAGNKMLSNIFIPESQGKIKTKYYINRLDIKNDNVLITGIGRVCLINPIYLKDPDRIVYDFPNTIINPEINNKKYQMNFSDDVVRIAQFEPSKVRLVIYTDNFEKYRPVFSFDMQSVLISNDDKISTVKLYDKVGIIKNISLKSQGSGVDNFLLEFSSPVIHSFRKNLDSFDLFFYNVSYKEVEKIKKILKNAGIENSQVENLSYSVIKIRIPGNPDSKFDYFETLDSKKIFISFKNLPKNESEGKIYNKNGVIIERKNLKNNIIVLDAGHGGTETGAIRLGILEKDITIDVTKRIANILTKKGFHIEMTRWNDETVSLQKRVEISDSINPILFMSVHVNASVNESVTGVETHYYKDDSKEYANVVQSELSKLNSPNRGVIKSKFYVINHTKAPAVLVEIGFLSNNDERIQLLSEKRKQQTAEFLANGIIKFIKAQKK